MMDDLRFYILFNSILVISGGCSDDNERLQVCNGTPFKVEKILSEDQTRFARSVGQRLINPLSYRGSTFLVFRAPYSIIFIVDLK